MGRYARATDVPSERSRAEIERILARYGATQFAYAWEERRAMVGFVVSGRRIRFLLPIPDRNSKEFTHTPRARQARTAAAAAAAYDLGVRQRWRALVLAIKAKLEIVESGIATFEEEFLAYVVLPDGATAGEWLRPQIARAYESGSMPPMLGLPGPGGVGGQER